MSEIVDHETGEILSVPAVARPLLPPTPYNSPETGQIAEALAKAQGEMDSPKRTKTGEIKGVTKAGKEYSYKYRYAPFEEIQRVIKEAFPKQGLMIQQGLVTRGDQFFVRTYIRHISGEWLASDFPVIADKSGPQGFAGATTYAKRYGLSLTAGLAAEDDDDGAAAQEAVPDAVPTATRAYPAKADPVTQTQLAIAAAQRIRKQIAEAQFIEQLNERGVFGPCAADDQRVIKREPRGNVVWEDLVRRDAERRMQLTPLPDDPIPDLASERTEPRT